jgi:DNA adenine methylase
VQAVRALEPSLRGFWGGREITPFLKWAGGKSQLLPKLVPFVPDRYQTYFEPFAGGGAMYFALQPPKAVLGDSNAELINCYRIVRDSVEELISALDRHHYDRDHYYAVRGLDPAALSPVEMAARTIFLNKTGYNGLYRVNRKGGFNVPFGRYKTPPRLCDPENLRRASKLLKGAEIANRGYLDSLEGAAAGDFVYLDPPYQPVSASANFTRYTKEGFREADQVRLAEEFVRLDKTGCREMLSNSDSELVQELYRNFQIDSVPVTRLINSDSSKRVGVHELVVRNY